MSIYKEFNKTIEALANINPTVRIETEHEENFSQVVVKASINGIEQEIVSVTSASQNFVYEEAIRQLNSIDVEMIKEAA